MSVISYSNCSVLDMFISFNRISSMLMLLKNYDLILKIFLKFLS